MSLLIYYVIVDKVVIARLVIVVLVTIAIVRVEEQFFIVLCLRFEHRAFIIATSLNSSRALLKRALNVRYIITDKIFLSSRPTIVLRRRLWWLSAQAPLLILIYILPSLLRIAIRFKLLAACSGIRL